MKGIGFANENLLKAVRKLANRDELLATRLCGRPMVPLIVGLVENPELTAETKTAARRTESGNCSRA